MKQFFKNRAWEKICRRLRTRHTRILPRPEQGLFNYNCHRNSLEYVRRHPCRNLDVVEVMYIDGGVPILHYIVRDNDRNEYLEVTLGHEAETLEYYFIRPVPPDKATFAAIFGEFSRSQEDWEREFIGWLGRFVLRNEQVL